MRLSRTCYDKAHRCPGWAGGGTKSAQTDKYHCNGYVTARRPWTGGDEDYPGHPSEHSWSFGHCNQCDVVTWPVVTRLLDPGWWRWRLQRGRLA